MSVGISENDLPSVKFDNELKNLMNYTALEGYNKKKTRVDEIDKWIQVFQSKMEKYSINSSKDSSFNYDKRCKDFNYLIKVIISKINSLSDDVVKRADWFDKIRELRNNFFSSNPSLNCDENKNYEKTDIKILDNFCEDSQFIKQKISEIQNSNKCQNIINNMFTRKAELINIYQKERRKHVYSVISNNCSTDIIDEIYPTINCTSITEHSLMTNEGGEPGNHVNSEALGETSRDGSSSPTDGLPHGGEVLTMPEENGENNNLGLVSLPIFGVLALSFLIYKYTPFGMKFNTYFQNKEDISINQDYEERNQILSNIPNSNDIYSENMEYNVSYQTL
ncbi:PIR Superfamily Protein [Plasmodium ovale wallikeri]|uniref:PIR Superfamily Protein n=1 Tax=Plasmodium ovale wallikeri TaxID=864142 RepID=A0A1A9AI87_PLAOA|nr:PIR Superfamily Protein [Plasmodium ovale wallikeri]